MTLDKIKARLGSLSAARINEMPKSAQHLLEVDMPRLIKIVETVQWCIDNDEPVSGYIRMELSAYLV
jgi:hypothetical protein